VATGVGHDRQRSEVAADGAGSSADGCPFYRRIRLRHELLSEGHTRVAFYDTTPLHPGHVLIIRKRHEPDFLTRSPEECDAVVRMVQELRVRTDQQLHPGGLTLGVNAGTVGSQMIDHEHLHLIPRHLGNAPEHKGAVRRLIPDRARHWADEALERCSA